MGDSTMILDETNRKNLIFLILQFLHEEGYEKSLHLLEQDSGAFFDYSYFSGFITNGKWKDAEDYLSSFTSPDTNTFSRKMFFDLYKWKFSEAPDRSGGSESANIFSNDLRRIPVFKDDGFEDLVEEDLIRLILQFLHEAKYKNTLHRFEQETKVFFNLNYLAEVMKLGEMGKAEEYLAAFTDKHANIYSKAMFLELQKLKWEATTPSGSLDNTSQKTKLLASVAMLAKKNPALKDILSFPKMAKSRLLTLMKQTMDWWRPHSCSNSNSLEHIPVVPYLCGEPSSLKNKLNGTGPRTKVGNCKLKEINHPSECSSLVLPDYWSGERHTPRVLKEDVFPKPRLHQPMSGKTMKNEIATSVEDSTSCFAIKGSYLFSTSGGKIAVFDLKSFERVAAFGSPIKPMATYFIFIPVDLLAVGLDDGSILIHCLSSRKLCVWSTKRWLKLTSIDSIQNFCTRLNNVSSLVTQIQFDPYQIELLVVQDKWISRHAAPTLDCLRQWVPDESEAAITSATYSSDGEIICVGFRSDSIKILDSMTFLIKCRINFTAFTQPIPSNIRVKVYPAVVAAHPSHPSQISVGLSNGRVIVLQPLGRGGWGEADALEDDRDNSDGLEHCY
ncbi:hypothetical protein YC2023_037188 [Brassica napus]